MKRNPNRGGAYTAIVVRGEQIELRRDAPQKPEPAPSAPDVPAARAPLSRKPKPSRKR
jgi:hypothetical protein